VPKKNIFHELKRYGIEIPADLKMDSIVYDYESLLISITDDDPFQAPKNACKRHVPISYSIDCDILDEPIFKLANGATEKDTQELLDSFVETLIDLSDQIYTGLKTKCEHVFDELEKRATAEKEFVEKSYYDALAKKLDSYLKKTPVLAFNSGGYDLPLVKKYLVLALKEQTKITGVIKRGSNFMAIFTPDLKFIDVTSFLAPGYNLNKYVGAYTLGELSKGYFPYDYMDDYEKLFETDLPPIRAFDNELKNSKLKPEEYAECEALWESKNMEFMWHFLKEYNNSDVSIFLQASINQSKFFRESYEINLFRDAISIPDIATNMCFSHKPDHISPMYTPSEKTYNALKRGILGGPSLVFSRYHNADEGTPLSNKHANVVKATTSRDCNAMYLTETSGDLPVGPCFYREAPNFKPKCEYPKKQFSEISQQWLKYEEKKLGQPIQMGDNELRILNRYVDGVSGNHVYQFSGCFYHGCVACTDHNEVHPYKEKTFGEIYDETMEFLQQLKNLGHVVHHTFECSFRKLKKENSELKQFLETLPKPYKPCAGLNCEEDVIKAVKNKMLRGFIQADIDVPDHLKSYYKGFEPIFKKHKISREDLSGVMAEYCEKEQCLKTPQEAIITSFYARQYLASTDLYAYYIERGFDVKNVTIVLEYEFAAPFKTFADKIVKVRREADSVDAQKPIASTMKLCGNTPYGKAVSNVENYSSVSFVDKKSAQKRITKCGFKHLTELSPNLYELDTVKSTLRYVLPTAFGVCVYSNAKLRLLQYVDYLRDHLDPDKFVYTYVDTDSVFVSTSEMFVEQCVLPKKRDSFFSQYEAFNVPTFCPQHKEMWVKSMTEDMLFVQPECCVKNEEFHSKTLGLFKQEAYFRKLVCLNSKSYYGEGYYEVHRNEIERFKKCGDSKFSSKGMNKTNAITFNKYKCTLFTQERQSAENRGFRSTLEGGMFTYKQNKFGLNFLYPKRHVCDDYVTTEPLNV
jgi:hypothetical protein